MTKLKSSAGFTLIEMLVTIVILVFLILGIGTGMDSALRIYNEARFASNSATAADVVNTALGDILRYADVEVYERHTETSESTAYFVFTNLEYGIRDGYFGLENGIITVKNTDNDSSVELVNRGSYPKLIIEDLTVTCCQRADLVKPYIPQNDEEYNSFNAVSLSNDINGSYFKIEYTVKSTVDSSLTRNVTYVVRCMNEM